MMKMIFIAIIALFSSLSCQKMRNINENTESVRNSKLATDVSKLHMRLLGENVFSMDDFIYHNHKIIGPVSYIGDTKGNFVEIDENDKKWKLKVVTTPKVEWFHIGAITVFNGELWFVFDYGTVVKSNLDANDWKIVSQVQIFSPRFISFANSKIGYLVGDIFTHEEVGCEIFKTKDGGKTWNKVFRSGRTGNLSALQIVDENKVLVAVNDSYLLQTQDGGKTWRPQGFEYEIKNFDMIGARNKTGANDITCSPDGKYWVVGKNGNIHFSIDKGNSWKKPSELPEFLDGETTLTSIAFSPEGKGIIVGYNGFMMITRDFGLNWEKVSDEIANKVMLKNKTKATSDDLIRVRFTKENFTILGSSGIYQISF